jgi:hypothetical protein
MGGATGAWLERPKRDEGDHEEAREPAEALEPDPGEGVAEAADGVADRVAAGEVAHEAAGEEVPEGGAEHQGEARGRARRAWRPRRAAAAASAR